jgi:hypothetical protein
MLTDRFQHAIEIFGDKKISKTWKCFEDFRRSVNKYYDTANILFDGEGYLTLKYVKALLAFHEALDGLCAFSEKNDLEDLQAIQESPHFHKVQQKAQDFLAAVKAARVNHLE